MLTAETSVLGSVAFRGAGLVIGMGEVLTESRQTGEHEFFLVLEGRAAYLRDGVELTVQRGDLILRPHGVSDALVWHGAAPTRHAYLRFTLNTLPAAWPRPEQWPPLRPIQEQDVLGTLFRALLDTPLPNSSDSSLTTAHILANFLGQGGHWLGDNQKSMPDAVARALRFIDQNLAAADSKRDLDLTTLADAAGVSREHLCRAFKQSTGHTPMEAVRLARLERAWVLLTCTRQSLSKIAERCGFADSFQFSRTFKRTYGYAPSRIRERRE